MSTMIRRCVVQVAIVAAAVAATYYWNAPWPTRVYLRHASALQQSAEDILQNPPADDWSGSSLPASLQGTDVSRIRVDGSCVIVSLATLPMSPSYQLVYSPGGYRALPIAGVRGPYNSFYELKRVDSDGKWFYWIRN